MKIAICDDCKYDIIYLEQSIRSSALCPANLEFYEFLSGEALMAKFIPFDAIFLDMQMQGGMNGVQTAEEIRKHDSDVLLSFYSSIELPARQILQVQPFGYLMKELKKDDFLSDVDTILRELERKKNRPQIHAICDGKVYILQLSDIIYISIFNKGSEIWLTEEKSAMIWEQDEMQKAMTLKSSIKIEEYYEMLKDYGFAIASKSYIINVMHIIAKEKYSVLLSNRQKLNISRGKKKEFDDVFGGYMEVQYYRERMRKE